MKKILLTLVVIALLAGAGYGYYYLVEQNKKEEKTEPTLNQEIPETETGAWNVTGFQLGNYMIKVTSEEKGHPSGKANFEVTFNYKDDFGYTNNILVDFYGVKQKIEQDYNDFDELEGIAINGLDYRIKDEKDDTKLLLHKIDDEHYLKIAVTLFSKVKYDAQGNLVEDEPIENSEVEEIAEETENQEEKEDDKKAENREKILIDSNILQREEIQKIINVTIEKISEEKDKEKTSKDPEENTEEHENENEE